jgi:hypothetical protein
MLDQPERFAKAQVSTKALLSHIRVSPTFECLRTWQRARPEVAKTVLDTPLPFITSHGFPRLADMITT